MKIGDLVRHKQSGGKYIGIIIEDDGGTVSGDPASVWWWIVFTDSMSRCLCREIHLEVINEGR